MIRWISLFFNDSEAMILMGGHMTERIFLRQGVPQGDIISPFIFIIAVEILLIKITKSKNIIGLKHGSREIRAQTFADDTSLMIERTELSLRSCVRYINAFKDISGLSANLDKTKVIPIGKFFNPKSKICPDLKMEWDNKFKLLGFNIENNLQNLDENFEIVHSRTLSLINDWRSRRLPLEGRISISKCLLVSQYTYIATILPLKESQINKAQTAINNFIMNIKEGDKPWISKEKIYQPVNKGGLNCIELASFFKSIKLNWIKRYITEKYDDFWTDKLDDLLDVTLATRKTILKWGSEQFNPAISKCKNPAIRSLLCSLQELTEKFVTSPETGDNRYIFQPIFHNKNLLYNKNSGRRTSSRKKMVTFQQVDFKLPGNISITVNEVFNRQNFISYEEFCEKITFIHENGYLALKHHLKTIFSPSGKYGPPIINKNVPEWNLENMVKLFESKGKGSKKFRRIIFQQKVVNTNLSSWKNSLNDPTINNDDIKKAYEFTSKKVLHPHYHDKKFRLLTRKTHFNNQLSKYSEISPFCQFCENNDNGTQTKEDLEHALFSCPNVKNLPKKVLENLKIENLTQFPVTASQVILHDPYSTAETLINAIWVLLTCFVLTNRLNQAPNIAEIISKKIKEIIIQTNSAYPNRDLSRECRKLDLNQFLASNEIGQPIHWSTFQTSSKL